jgi:hypothetical protein
VVNFKIKRVYNSSKSGFPDLRLSRKSKEFLESGDHFGESMVFRLDSKIRDANKNSDAEVNSPRVHFEGQVDSLDGNPHLDVENEDMKHVMNAIDVNKDGRISKKELGSFSLTAVSTSSLIENHSRDADVTSYLPSENVHFEYTPKPVLFGKPGPGVLDFVNDIVSIGIDESGNVISFICPQRTDTIDNAFISGTLKSEVEVGEVGGKIDPLTGIGVIYGDDLAWKFWGDINVFGQLISISKEDAAFIPIQDNSGTGGLLALYSTTKNAVGGGDINNVFSSYFIQGLQGNPYGIQKGTLQETVIQAVNANLPGFTNGGTTIQWNINLKDPVAVVGDEYLSKAHDLEMH